MYSTIFGAQFNVCKKAEVLSNNDMWDFINEYFDFGILNVKIAFLNTCDINFLEQQCKLPVCLNIKSVSNNIYIFQSRGSSPLSPFLDHLGSPPPAHMGALR